MGTPTTDVHLEGVILPVMMKRPFSIFKQTRVKEKILTSINSIALSCLNQAFGYTLERNGFVIFISTQVL